MDSDDAKTAVTHVLELSVSYNSRLGYDFGSRQVEFTRRMMMKTVGRCRDEG